MGYHVKKKCWILSCSTYLEAVLTFTSMSPLKTNCPGFHSYMSLFHSQCMFSVVL